MILSELSIRRPVLATVTSLVIVLVGLMAWSRLTVRKYPNIDEPLVSVTTSYNGALAEVIESQVTQPLEDALSIIEGLDLMTSSNRSERSQITLQFRVTRESAATLRLRSILMATGAMVLGSVPLVLAEGAGAESRQAIGWMIVGGLLLGMLLTLYVVPTACMLLARPPRPPEAAVMPAAAPAEQRRRRWPAARLTCTHTLWNMEPGDRP